MSITAETLLALPVGSLVSFPTQPDEDMYDEDGNLYDGFVETEIFARAGYHYFHDFVSLIGAGEADAKFLAERPELKLVFTYPE